MAVTALLVLCSLVLASAQSWPQWRGPLRTGAATTFKVPATWPDRLTRVWKVQAGEGHSSPLAVAGRVYLLSRIGEQEAVTAFELSSGKVVWRQSYDAPYQMNPAATTHGKGPKSTPALDSGRLFSFGISGILSAWQASDGRLLWRKNFKTDFKSQTPDFGVATSPLVVGNLVIVHAGGAGSGALMALDVASGAVKWSLTPDGPSYASPIVADIAGTRQIVSLSQSRLVGLALADGQLLWQIPFTTDFDQNSVTPVAIDDLVVYSGLGKPATAVRVSHASGGWRAEQVWQNADVPMYMSTPVVANGFLFGLTQRSKGQFFCLDLRSGKTTWVTRGRDGDNAAFVTASGLVMAVTTDGELVVARDDPKQFDLVKRYTVADSPVWAHPAVVETGFVIKDVATLAYWTF